MDSSRGVLRNRPRVRSPAKMTATTSPRPQTRLSLPNEVHPAPEHPNDLLVWVTVRLDMHASPDTPPYDHPLVAGENAPASVFTDLLLG